MNKSKDGAGGLSMRAALDIHSVRWKLKHVESDIEWLLIIGVSNLFMLASIMVCLAVKLW
jgi:hypothetical protein